jgi:hypothetical protein
LKNAEQREWRAAGVPLGVVQMTGTSSTSTGGVVREIAWQTTRVDKPPVPPVARVVDAMSQLDHRLLAGNGGVAFRQLRGRSGESFGSA